MKEGPASRFGGEQCSYRTTGEPMSDIPKATVKQLAYKIRGSGQNPRPRFSFFLGAGASVQSQIPSAGEMIRDFRKPDNRSPGFSP
jgi:hypothetical protein